MIVTRLAVESWPTQLEQNLPESLVQTPTEQEACVAQAGGFDGDWWPCLGTQHAAERESILLVTGSTGRGVPASPANARSSAVIMAAARRTSNPSNVSWHAC